MHWKRNVEATAVSAVRDEVANTIKNIFLSGSIFGARFMVEYSYDQTASVAKDNTHSILVQLMYEVPEVVMKQLTFNDPLGAHADDMDLRGKFSDAFADQGGKMMGFFGKGTDYASSIITAIGQQLSTVIPTETPLHELLVRSAVAQASKPEEPSKEDLETKQAVDEMTTGKSESTATMGEVSYRCLC